MSEGQMTEEDIQLLKERIVPENAVPRDVLHLFYSNIDVNNYNAVKLAVINSEEFISTAKDTIKASNLTDRSKQQILEAVKNFKVSETQGLSWQLQLKTSAKYMVTVNINTSDGLLNGASGELMQIDRTNTAAPFHINALWIKFSEDSVGILARRKQPHPTHSDWTCIEKIVRTFQYKKNEQVSVERKQFPVVPAEAITVHKSQGATYQKVALHVKKGMNRSALYVGCSRATTASGLFIIGPFSPPKPFAENDLVKLELTKLRNEKLLRTHYEMLLDSSRCPLRLYYQNVQSLPAHLKDIQCDDIITSSDILCFVETWAFSGENFPINGFNIVANMNGTRSSGPGRPANGIIIFVKAGIEDNVQVLFYRNICENGKVYQLIAFKHMENSYVVVYRNAKYPIQEFRERVLADIRTVIEEQPGRITIVGDFNICRLSCVDSLEEELRNLEFSSLLGNVSTTKQNTHIDWLFSNNEASRGLTYETAFSHHEGIFICLR